MPNIGTVLKEEIVRLSRKEGRRQNDPTKKTATYLRHDVAEQKRQVAQLERQVALLSRKALGALPKADGEEKPARFSAKGLKAQRSRLDLGRATSGSYLGVSAQSIYNWEAEKARPRSEQIAKLAALRSVGKREATARLEQLNGAKG
jgi:DNA-binding XRE family transcriptional regulator